MILYFVILYEKISNDAEIKGLIARIDADQVNTLPSDHGIKHVMFCVNFVERFLKMLGCDSRTIELAKVAAFLHDIGSVQGKENHVQNSVIFVKDYFNRINIEKCDAEIIIDAIANHSAGKELNSVVSAALVLADKCHWTRDRIIENCKFDYSYYDVPVIPHIDKIDKIVPMVTDKELILTYHVLQGFNPKSIEIINGVKPVFPKIANYLGKELKIEIVSTLTKV